VRRVYILYIYRKCVTIRSTIYIYIYIWYVVTHSRLFNYTYYKRPVTRSTTRINVHILETGRDKSVIEASRTSRVLNFLRVFRTAEQIINRSENEPLNFIDILITRVLTAVWWETGIKTLLSQISQDSYMYIHTYIHKTEYTYKLE